MDVDLVNSSNGITSASLSGNSFNARGIADYYINEKFSGRAQVGYELFETDGTVADSSCSGANTCVTEINYFAIEALGRYTLTGKKFRFWLGGGLGILHPLSKTSNAVVESSISTTFSIIGSLGIDYALNSKAYIPVWFSYNYLSPSDDVSARFLNLNVGYAFKF